MSAAKQIQIEMIQADMQQSLELLAVGQYDLALHHIREALRKAHDMKEADGDDLRNGRSVAASSSQQITLDIEAEKQ